VQVSKMRQKQKSPAAQGLSGLSGRFQCRWKRLKTQFLAEQAGFEPAVGINPHTLSRRAT
jgi:hypothetical protein